MTVLYLTNNPQLAGTARILQSWLRLGPRFGISACVLAPRRGQLQQWLEDGHIPYRLSSMPWPDRRRPWASLFEGLRVAWWARRRGVTLIHCNEHDVLPFAQLLRKLLRVPLICHVRFSLNRGFCEWALGGARQPDALLWTSKQQRDDCADAIRGLVPVERQHLIPLGPDPEVFGKSDVDRGEILKRFWLKPGDIVIGTATAMRPIKRLEDFVRLIAEIASQDPRVVGLIAAGAIQGDEAYLAEIQRLIAAADLGDRLRWLGHLEPVEPFLRALDIFVSTSEYETFGNSVCEAMACARPVAAYVGGSVHEIVGDAGRIVPNGDFESLKKTVLALVGDPDERARLGQSGSARVAEHFNPSVSFDRLRSIYADALRRHHGTPDLPVLNAEL
jgi:glycosyltransferase involved in cell wall biosynthesis